MPGGLKLLVGVLEGGVRAKRGAGGLLTQELLLYGLKLLEHGL